MKESQNMRNQLKARIQNLKLKPPKDIYEEAIKWLNIDKTPIQLLKI